ncbi:MAG: hypothetical protein GOV01_02165 [Candidatus Altiarchaeota archaeon]|nr:hypothetical protein [Candidatus Altiarchaeota archaeon]
MEELEGKLVGVNVEKLLSRLMELEIKANDCLQEDQIFSHGDGMIRIRKEGERFFLTHKGQLNTKGVLKSRDETEFEITQPEEAIKFLKLLEVDTSKPLTRKKKLFRFEIEGATGELVFIDKLPPTLELEGSEKQIKKACKKLALDFNKLQPISWSDVQPI